MAGHSKWKNIQHRKGRQDAKRSKDFTRASKEIIIAAKGGGNPAFNPRLRGTVAVNYMNNTRARQHGQWADTPTGTGKEWVPLTDFDKWQAVSISLGLRYEVVKDVSVFGNYTWLRRWAGSDTLNSYYKNLFNLGVSIHY